MQVFGRLDDGRPELNSGPDFPANPRIGAIFEKTGDNYGPYFFNGTEWKLMLTGSVVGELGYTPLNKAGDTMTGSLGMPKASGTGIKIEEGFGWRDLPSEQVSRRTGTDAPTLSVWDGDIQEYAYSASDVGDCRFHIPHDYVPGSNLYIHIHWGHNGTDISGSFEVTFHAGYAKGHSQATFSSQKNASLVVGSLNITNSPQKCHRTDEIQFSTVGGSATLIDTSALEADGLILVNYEIDGIPTITGSASANQPFIFGVDLHYQSSNLGTKNKAPGFHS